MRAKREWLGISYFIHPVPAFAVLLMAANDSYLKVHYHNWLTGKLSDWAGVFFLPLFLVAATGVILNFGIRRKPFFWISPHALLIAILVTDIIFIAIKLFPPVTVIYLELMARLGFPSRLTRDPTDLSALAFNFMTFRHGRRFWIASE
jgi:hypothetical protein